MFRRYLLAALEEAWRGRGQCAPNPSVGAVLVHDGEIISSAYHEYAGGPHAEQRLLDNLNHPPPPHSTLCVTLEPCNHWGKTPPCVDWIIACKIERVVFACRDINPIVSRSDTPGILQAHGIEVIHEPLNEIDCFYKSYCHWRQTGKPWISAKIAQSLDGKIAVSSGVKTQITNQACSELTHHLRQHSDVILTTAKTTLIDNPLLNARIGTEERAKNIAILDRQLILTGEEHVFKHAKAVHVFYDKQLTPQNRISHCIYHPVSADNFALNLNEVFENLGALGYHDLFVEAGGQLFSALHHAKLVNTTYFYIAPAIFGPDAPHACNTGEWFQHAHRVTWMPQKDNMVMRVDWAI